MEINITMKGKRLTDADFLDRLKEVHGDTYDYSLVKYVNMHTPIDIICPIHGVFSQKPYKHLQGKRCHKCFGTHKKTKNEFISEAKAVHGNKYDYSNVVYRTCETKVEIKCNDCGTVFYQLPYAHLQGKGCGFCNGGSKMTIEQFIQKAKKIHGDKYDYSKVEYKNNKTKVCIICKEHGIFYQTPNDHLDGCGCPICNESRLESMTRLKLDEKGLKYVSKYKADWLQQQHLDFYLPDLNIGIECQGIQHFKPVEFFGGDEQLKRQIELDEKKKRLCEENNVEIIYLSSFDEIDRFFEKFK